MPAVSRRPLVLVIDPIRSSNWSYEVEERLLAERGIDLLLPADAAGAEAAMDSCDVAISSSILPIGADVIARLTSCVGILCYSAGKDAVDESAARAADIPVANVNAATSEVADHAMALLLASVRLIVPMSQAAAAGAWKLSLHPEIWQIPRLDGRVLGVVGAGHIGKAVAHRARAFGLGTIATYHHPPAAPDPLLPHAELGELFARSDVVVVAASLNEETRGMVDAEVLAQAKPGLVIINIARGGLIDEEALADALDAGIVAAAALDVRAQEPPDTATDRLGGRPNVIQTPHIGGASAEARIDLHVLAARGVIKLLEAAGRVGPAHT